MSGYEKKLAHAIKYLRGEISPKQRRNLYVLDSHVKENTPGRTKCVFRYTPVKGIPLSFTNKELPMQVIDKIFCDADYAMCDCSVHVAKYSNERLAIQLFTVDSYREPLMTLTVNLPAKPCKRGEIYIKDYSENEGASRFAVKAKIVEEPSVGSATSGFAVLHRWKLHPDFLALLEEKGFPLGNPDEAI